MKVTVVDSQGVVGVMNVRQGIECHFCKRFIRGNEKVVMASDLNARPNHFIIMVHEGCAINEGLFKRSE